VRLAVRPGNWYKRAVYKFVQSAGEQGLFAPVPGDLVSTWGAAADAAGRPISR
jgi:hypothetical protein